MPQPIKKEVKKISKSIPKKKYPKQQKTKRKHQEYGTSKLEERFAHNFLDKLGVEYIYQFKAESIGRYFDFKIEPDGPIFEVNGGYWHGDPRLYESKDLKPFQIKAQKIDEYKKKWALRNGIPIYYFWEKDINETPEKVLNKIKEILFTKNNYKNSNKQPIKKIK